MVGLAGSCWYFTFWWFVCGVWGRADWLLRLDVDWSVGLAVVVSLCIW